MIGKVRGAWAEINLDAIENNIEQVKKSCGDKEIIAVIKADGYGHGAVGISKELIDNGAKRFAVATLPEAVELRRAGVEIPIMTLGFIGEEFYDEIVDYNIEQTIFSYDSAKVLSDIAMKKNKIAKIHIAVDTGMGRIGFLTTIEQAQEVHKISKLPSVKIVGIFTHFATADEKDKKYTELQIERFKKFNSWLEDLGVYIPFKHVSNSAAIIDLPDLEYEGVRAGIMMYGYYPSTEVNMEEVNLIPVLTLKARIIHLKTLNKGEGISYGKTYITDRVSKIATLPIGYADGLSRLQAGKGKVIIGGKIVPIVGRICMDQCMVDVTEVPDVKIGDEVILIGSDDYGNKITADDLANHIGTISYEILCDISKRIPRIYIKKGEIIEEKNYGYQNK